VTWTIRGEARSVKTGFELMIITFINGRSQGLNQTPTGTEIFVEDFRKFKHDGILKTGKEVKKLWRDFMRPMLLRFTINV